MSVLVCACLCLSVLVCACLVNYVVPVMAKLNEKKALDPMNIVGITSLDVVRADKFVGKITVRMRTTTVVGMIANPVCYVVPAMERR